MLPESTTTTGDSLPVIHMSPFQIISADVTIIPEKECKHRFSYWPINILDSQYKHTTVGNKNMYAQGTLIVSDYKVN